MRNTRRPAVALATFLIVGWATSAHANSLAGLVDSADAAGAVILVYDPADGNLRVQANDIEGVTTFELRSSSGMFSPENIPEGTLGASFDLGYADKVFKFDTTGFTQLDLGPILPTAMKGDELLTDLSVNGSLSPMGTLEDAPNGGPYLHVVPEPSSFVLSMVGLLAGLGLLRRP